MITDEQLKAARQTQPQWLNRPWFNDPATDRQRSYLATLVETREVPKEWLERLKDYEESGTLTKGVAGKAITSIQALPWKEKAVKDGNMRSIPKPTWKDVPAGYYAIPAQDPSPGANDIYFYKVWKPKDKEDYGQLYRVIGPDVQRMPWRQEPEVLKAIVRFGVGNAAILYGQKIGRCSKCHRRLSNRVSRELAIGPICGGRYFPDDWYERVTNARQAITERGEDPDEKIVD